MTAQEIVQNYFGALGQKDYASARSLLHDDLSFKGPIDTFDNADAYSQAIQGLSAIVQSVQVQKMFVDGDDVCIIYDMVTNTPAGTAPIAEWYKVRGEKIGAIRVFFDARPFAG